MTNEPRSTENRPADHTRRSVLKAAGGVASALAGVAAMGSVTAQTANTVDIVSEGADDTGETPIDEVLQSAVAPDTEIVFPEGTYRLSGFSADGLQNVSFVGEDATLVPPDGSTGQLLGLSGTNVSVEGFTFDYTAPNTAAMVSMQCSDGLLLKDCDFVGVADVPGGSGGSGHEYHVLPAVTDPGGSGLIENVSLADGTINPSNRGGIWLGQNNQGTLTLDGVHLEQWANNSLYCYESAGPVIVKNSFFRNNNVGGPRIGSNGSKVIDTTIVSDGEVPVQAFTGGRTSRGIWIPAACEDMLIQGCDFVMTGPHANSGIVYDAPNANADVKDCRFEMDVDRPAIQCGVSGGPISIERISVTGDAASEDAIAVNGRADVSDVCIGGPGNGNACPQAKSLPPQANGNPGGKSGRNGESPGNGSGAGSGNGGGNGNGAGNGNGKSVGTFPGYEQPSQ